ncbi:sarcospan isoform X2 [Vespula squamosa]|uniref:Sarcospan isoform X2 n=1 Tax=Vespula squamosa TaxID=30214 RepID=A0ABD2A6W8_VESSQ
MSSKRMPVSTINSGEYKILSNCCLSDQKIQLTLNIKTKDQLLFLERKKGINIQIDDQKNRAQPSLQKQRKWEKGEGTFRMSEELRTQRLGTLSHGEYTMQAEEEIQYAPRSRPVSFYDNFKLLNTTISNIV